jgi:hypothetical protein
MLSRTQLRLPIVISGVLLASAACTDQPGEDASSVAAALEQDNGGLQTTDESPMFGAADAFAAAAVERDTTVTDSLDVDASVVAMRARPDALHARVAIVWGQLPPDRTADTVHDWSGSLTINRGALVVHRLIGFEEGMDHLTPRADRHTVSFQSVTRPFADGLVLEVLDDEPAAADPLTITYTRNDGTVLGTFPIAGLLAAPISIDVDAENRIIATALRRDGECDHGFMRGRWHQLRDGKGVFMGVVADADGAPIGHLRGIWGERRSGEQVFFAKYIDRDGHFRGILAGHYADGSFQGRWLTRDGEHGRAGGHYREGAPGGAVGGAFIGRWAETSCAADLPTDAP